MTVTTINCHQTLSSALHHRVKGSQALNEWTNNTINFVCLAPGILIMERREGKIDSTGITEDQWNFNFRVEQQFLRIHTQFVCQELLLKFRKHLAAGCKYLNWVSLTLILQLVITMQTEIQNEIVCMCMEKGFLMNLEVYGEAGIMAQWVKVLILKAWKIGLHPTIRGERREQTHKLCPLTSTQVCISTHIQAYPYAHTCSLYAHTYTHK